MKSWISGLLGLIIGGGAGFVVGAKVVQKKLNTLHEKEINDIKHSFSEYYCTKEEVSTASIGKGNNKQPDIKPFVQKSSIDEVVIKESPKVDYSKDYIDATVASQQVKDEAHERLRDKSKPYVITEREYAESIYNVKTLFYHSDGKISDDFGNLVDDVDLLVGDALTHYNKEDVFYVRNDDQELDYEIMYESKPYTSMYGTSNYVVGEDGLED